MNKKIVYIDMDDTICDFTNAYKNALILNPKQPYPQAQTGFFLQLKPIEHAIDSVKILKHRGYDVNFLTRPSFMNANCYTEKRLWIEIHFGLEWCEKLYISPDKSKHIGDYLIDDKIWEGFIGEQIHFGYDKFKTWLDVLDYLK